MINVVINDVPQMFYHSFFCENKDQNIKNTFYKKQSETSTLKSNLIYCFAGAISSPLKGTQCTSQGESRGVQGQYSKVSIKKACPKHPMPERLTSKHPCPKRTSTRCTIASFRLHFDTQTFYALFHNRHLSA